VQCQFFACDSKLRKNFTLCFKSIRTIERARAVFIRHLGIDKELLFPCEGHSYKSARRLKNSSKSSSIFPSLPNHFDCRRLYARVEKQNLVSWRVLIPRSSVFAIRKEYLLHRRALRFTEAGTGRSACAARAWRKSCGTCPRSRQFSLGPIINT
jgi:hypothetical protein